MTVASGQNRFVAHGVAILAVTTLSIARARVPVRGTSLKWTPLVAERWNVRTRNTAISPRLTLFPGQNIVFFGGLQGLMIPAAATVSIAASNREPLSSTNRPEPAATVVGEATRRAQPMIRTIWMRRAIDTGALRARTGCEHSRAIRPPQAAHRYRHARSVVL